MPLDEAGSAKRQHAATLRQVHQESNSAQKKRGRENSTTQKERQRENTASPTWRRRKDSSLTSIEGGENSTTPKKEGRSAAPPERMRGDSMTPKEAKGQPQGGGNAAPHGWCCFSSSFRVVQRLPLFLGCAAFRASSCGMVLLLLRPFTAASRSAPSF